MVGALAGLGAVSRETLDRVAKRLEQNLSRYAHAQMRQSFLRGDWKSLEEAVTILETRGRLSSKWRLPTAVAKRYRGLAWILSCLQRLMAWESAFKRFRKRGTKKTSMEEVIRLYSGDATLSGGR